jgi:hypothetical protein
MLQQIKALLQKVQEEAPYREQSESLSNETIELTKEEAEKISGGFNPQPDPPGVVNEIILQRSIILQ